MAILIFNLGDNEELLELSMNDDISIGSDEDADVFLPHSEVAPRHANISADAVGECWIRDLDSTQGTFVNGRRIKFRKLSPGDKLRFGSVKVLFVGLQTPAAQPMQNGIAPQLLPGTSAAAVCRVPLEYPGLDRPVPPTETATGGTCPENQSAPAAKPNDARAETLATSTLSSATQPAPLPRPESSSNQSRSGYLLRLFFLLALTNAALFFACAIWFYSKTKSDFEKRFELLAKTFNPAITAMPVDQLQSASDTVITKLTSDSDNLKKQNAVLHSTLDDLQKKITASEKLTVETTRQLAGLSALVDEVNKSASKKDATPIVQATGEGIPSASQTELVLLKERNRLTAFADEAIATGARDPYDRLWDAIEDPRLANLVHAARAEILRVQDCYINGQRVKFYGIQQHQIPVADIFPESASLAPAQLSDDQLIQVLQDLKQPWQTRVKAAWHLGQRRSTKVGDALVKAIKSDPMLDVAAEATFSFEQITGYHAKLFDVQPMEAWWKSYNERPPVNKSPAGTPNDAGPDTKVKAQ